MLENSLIKYAVITTFSILLGCFFIFLFIQAGITDNSLYLSTVIMNFIASCFIWSRSKRNIYFVFGFLLVSFFTMFVGNFSDSKLLFIIYLVNGALFPALAIVYLNLLEGYKNGLSIILFTIFFYLVFLLAFNGSLFFTYAFFSTWVHV
ncbi:hypothetical protein H4W00_002479 [Psychrobacter sp. PL19]